MTGTVAELAAVEGIRVTRPRVGVTLITLDRPERYNALDEPIVLGLAGLFEGLAGDPETRAVVVCGAGPAFCAGGDLDLIRKVGDDSVEGGEAFLRRVLEPVVALRRLPQPTIAAVNGPVAGSGLGIALACDIRIAAPSATFSAPFIHQGLVPEMGVTWLLPRLVGLGPAIELVLSGRQVEATEAQSLGLVTRICDEPVPSALSLAATFAAMPPRAAAVTKRLLQRAMRSELETAVAAEAREQVAAVHGREFSAPSDLWAG